MASFIYVGITIATVSRRAALGEPLPQSDSDHRIRSRIKQAFLSRQAIPVLFGIVLAVVEDALLYQRIALAAPAMQRPMEHQRSYPGFAV